MTPSVLHPEVIGEWLDALEYYEAIHEDLSEAFNACVENYLDRIRAHPELFRIRRLQVRRVNLNPQFNEWYLAYMLWHGRVVILALGHAKRRPFYFRERIAQARTLF